MLHRSQIAVGVLVWSSPNTAWNVGCRLASLVGSIQADAVDIEPNPNLGVDSVASIEAG